MSINVNVNGNPVSINRGKMVVHDPNFGKQEFEKRRKIRLEQVREQSKTIAEDVRNKVRKEKDKQLSNLEKKGEQELKKWQAKKLLALQKQYQECLQDLGLGHMNAVVEEDSNYADDIRKNDCKKNAERRGNEATEKLQQEKIEEELEKIAYKNRKKYNEAIEKTRSSMVINLNKNRKSPFKKKRKQVSTNINIESKLSTSSDTENEVPGLLKFKNQYSNDSSAFSCDESQNSVRSCSPVTRKDQSAQYSERTPESNVVSTKNVAETQRKTRRSCAQASCSYWPFLDTRISDHIRSRTISHAEFNKRECGHIGEKHTSLVSSNRSKSPQKSVPADLQTNDLPKDVTAPEVTSEEPRTIPTKPKISLRTLAKSKTTCKSETLGSAVCNKILSNKVQYYDHKNRFSKEYSNDDKNVHRIDEESVEVCSSTCSYKEYQEKMNKRDHDAEVRGKIALHKVKVQKDYQQMMQQLPNLQKQEKIAAIPLSNLKFHMSEDRLKEMEKKKQDRMENAYDKLFPKPRTITIPPKSPKKAVSNNLPYQTIDVENDSHTLNVASWDFDSKPSTSTKPTNIESKLIKKIADQVMSEASSLENSTSNIQTTQNLQGMLKNLTTSRDKLVQELASLPPNSEFHTYLAQTGGLQSINKIIEAGQVVDKKSTPTKRKRGRSKKKEGTKMSSNTLRSSTTSPERTQKTSKYHHNCTGETSASLSPPSKRSNNSGNIKKSVKKPSSLHVQTISTQTTPRIEETAGSSIEKKSVTSLLSRKTELPPVLEVPSQEALSEADNNKQKVSCFCNVEGNTVKNITGHKCEIIIRINEDGKPEICVSPVEGKSQEIIVKTDIEEVPLIKKCDTENLNQLKHKPKEGDKKKINRVNAKQRKNKVKLFTRQKIPPTSSSAANQAAEQKALSQQPQGKLWREHLNQNSTNSSTSYFSPPDLQKYSQYTNSTPSDVSGYFNSTTYNSLQNQSFNISYHRQNTSKPCQDFTNILKDKPQQRNILTESHTEKSLVGVIKTLLTMSRKSVQDLGVSSISDVSTPTSSIINISTNFNVQQIQNAMNKVNFEIPNVSQPTSYSADESNVHYNTVDSLTVSSTDELKFNSFNNVSQALDKRKLSLDEYCAENYSSVVSTYNKMADSYTQRIQSLSAKIDKLRLEKANILQTSGYDKDGSTRYLDLPTSSINKSNDGKDAKSSGSSTAEQEELERHLLSIDYGLVERLKKMTPEEFNQQFGSKNDENGIDLNQDSVDQELINRFNKLFQRGNAKTDNVVQFEPAPTVVSASEPFKEHKVPNDEPFVPILADIPRFRSSTIDPSGKCSCKSTNPKPPVSKGITAVKRLNTDIHVIPHELSTIAESELSTKMRWSPDKPSLPAIVDYSPNLIVQMKQFVALPELEPTQEKTSNSDNLPNIITEAKSKPVDKQQHTNKSPSGKTVETEPVVLFAAPLQLGSTDDLSSDSMEKMLKSLGMDWAIPTLRKTQEALNLQSSSSASDVTFKSSRIFSDSNSSSSEISLREMLGKNYLRKLASHTPTKSLNSISLNTDQFDDVSPIIGSSTSPDKKTHRTSTPVQSHKPEEKSKNDNRQPSLVATSEYELSSIKGSSEDSVPSERRNS